MNDDPNATPAGDDADDTAGATGAMPVDEEVKPDEGAGGTPAQGADEIPAQGTAVPGIGEPVGGGTDVKTDEPATDEEKDADDDTVE